MARGPRPGRRGPPAGRPRTASRVAAVQALFQSEQGGEAAETVIDQFVRHRLGELPGPEHLGGGGFEQQLGLMGVAAEGRIELSRIPQFLEGIGSARVEQPVVTQGRCEIRVY